MFLPSQQRLLFLTMPVDFALPLQPEELLENVGTEKYAVESSFDLDMGPDALIEALDGTRRMDCMWLFVPFFSSSCASHPPSECVCAALCPELDSQLKMNPTTLYEHDVFDKLFKLATYVASLLSELLRL
jgi:hypothetical protein